MLQLTGNSVEPQTLHLVRQRGAMVKEAATINLQMAKSPWLLAAAGSPEAGAEGASRATVPAEEVTNLRHFVATRLLELGRLRAEAPRREWKETQRRLHGSLTVERVLHSGWLAAYTRVTHSRSGTNTSARPSFGLRGIYQPGATRWQQRWGSRRTTTPPCARAQWAAPARCTRQARWRNQNGSIRRSTSRRDSLMTGGQPPRANGRRARRREHRASASGRMQAKLQMPLRRHLLLAVPARDLCTHHTRRAAWAHTGFRTPSEAECGRGVGAYPCEHRPSGLGRAAPDRIAASGEAWQGSLDQGGDYNSTHGARGHRTRSPSGSMLDVLTDSMSTVLVESCRAVVTTRLRLRQLVRKPERYTAIRRTLGGTA